MCGSLLNELNQTNKYFQNMNICLVAGIYKKNHQKSHEVKLEDTKVVIRSHKSKKNRQYNGQKNKQRSTKH